MDITLLSVDKPLDKHGTTPVHITYTPLEFTFSQTELGRIIKSLGCRYIKLNSRLVGETEASYNSLYSNPCSVKSIKYLNLLFISLDSAFVALEREVFELTKGCLMREKIEP